MLTCFTVRVSRSRTIADTGTPASPHSPIVDDCTVNKALPPSRLESYAEWFSGDAIELARSHSQGLWTDPEQDRGAFFRSEGRHRRVSADTIPYKAGGQDGNPSPKAGSKTVFSGTENPGETHVPKKKETGVFSNEVSIPQVLARTKTNEKRGTPIDRLTD